MHMYCLHYVLCRYSHVIQRQDDLFSADLKRSLDNLSKYFDEKVRSSSATRSSGSPPAEVKRRSSLIDSTLPTIPILQPPGNIHKLPYHYCRRHPKFHHLHHIAVTVYFAAFYGASEENNAKDKHISKFIKALFDEFHVLDIDSIRNAIEHQIKGKPG